MGKQARPTRKLAITGEDKSIIKGSENDWKSVTQPWEFAYWKKVWKNDFDPYNDSRDIWTALGHDQNFLRDKYVLDVGCGPTGRLSYFEQHKGSGKIWAMDPLLDQYRTLPSINFNVYDHLVCCATEDKREELVDTFDLIISLNALDHGYDISLACNNLYSYLKQDGVAFISLDCCNTIHPDPTHPIRITKDRMSKVLEDAKFTITSLTNTPCYPGGRENWGHGIHWHWWLKK